MLYIYSIYAVGSDLDSAVGSDLNSDVPLNEMTVRPNIQDICFFLSR